ncbi:11344_t:CDS:1, partial [Diversispora eburnea]
MSIKEERFKGSYGRRASNSLSVEELDEYKRDIPPSATSRRLFNPNKDPIVMISKTKKSAEADDEFIPARRANVGRKLFNYDDKTFEREDLFKVNIKRNDIIAQASVVKSSSPNNNHTPTKNVNESRNNNLDQIDGNMRKDSSNSETLAKTIKLLSKKIASTEKIVEKFNKINIDESSASCKVIYDEQYWQEKIEAHL